MKYLSVCSGIEAATVAWHGLGWKAAAYSEIEAFPSAVLAHHYPDVPNVGDMTKYKEWNIEQGSIDLLVGGTPCQSFSVAGLRKGLADPRGNLALVYCGILDHFKPRWFVWENVPGVLSSGGGRDFGSFLGAVAELGYGFAYRVLDAQWFGVAQRRRRVFVVGHLGDWRSAATVLFEPESLRGDPAPSREKGEEVAGTFTARAKSGGWGHDPNLAAGGYMRPVSQPYPIANTLTARMRKGINSTLDEGQTPVFARTSWRLFAPALVGPTIGSSGPPYSRTGNERVESEALVVAVYPLDMRNAGRDPEKYDEVNRQGVGVGQDGDPAHTVTSAHVHAVAVGTDCYNGAITGDVAATMGTPGSSINASGPTVMTGMQVRRLTPVECERLQGFPDRYTNIPWRGKPESPDGPRYKALGNSMAVPVMRWLGERIAFVQTQR